MGAHAAAAQTKEGAGRKGEEAPLTWWMNGGGVVGARYGAYGCPDCHVACIEPPAEYADAAPPYAEGDGCALSALGMAVG